MKPGSSASNRGSAATRLRVAALLLAGLAGCDSSAEAGKAETSTAANETGTAESASLRAMSAADLHSEIQALAQDGPLVLNFWATWCPPCLAELPDFADAARANPDIQFAAISCDWAAADFAKGMDVNIALASKAWSNRDMPFPSYYCTETGLEEVADMFKLPTGVLPQTLLYKDGKAVEVIEGRMHADDFEDVLASLR